MLFRIFSSFTLSTHICRQMSEAPLKSTSKTKYNGKFKKRNWEARAVGNSDEPSAQKGDTTDEKRPKIERIKKRKYALLLGYSGVNYFGMQRNPGMKTIEEDLHTALHKCKLIDDIAFNQIQNIQFQRAARTDKGVSAVRQICSLKLPEVFDIAEINSNLPECIRVFSIKRVTKGFNSKSNCDARTYTYMLPTFAFAPFTETIDQENFRINGETMKKVNDVLQMYLGSKNFHNFTSKKKFRDPSAMRFIISFEMKEPFVRENVEFAILQIKGQSFMLHQIRKMVGLAIAIVRGQTTAETISKAWLTDKLDIPMAPGLGLILEQVHYESYNARYGSDHEKLEWDEVEPIIQKFKEEHIYPTIVNTEIKENSMKLWLETLPKHSYDVRVDDSDRKDTENEGPEED